MRRLALAMIAVLLVGCAQGGPAPASPSSPVDLQAARRSAGIADCPASDPTVAAVAGGLPDLTLDCLGGGSSVRLAGLRGKPMVINLWAQWCAPCREEAPFLREFAARAGDQVLLLGIDYNDPRPELAVEFASLVGWRQPQLVDEDKALAAPLRLPGIPVTLLVDGDGRIRGRHDGPFRSTEELVELVNDKLGVRL